MADSKIIKIPIIDNYSVSIDSLRNHTLYYKTIREVIPFKNKGTQKTGELKECEEILGYYSDMKWVYAALIKDAARRGINEGIIKTIQEYMEFCDRMLERIENIKK